MKFNLNVFFKTCSWILLVAVAALAADHYEVTIDRGVTVKMRDGITLRADIYRPKADGKFPVLLQRTPYDKKGVSDFALRAAPRGYVSSSRMSVDATALRASGTLF